MVKEFTRVGPELEFGHSLVELADAQPIHDLAVGDLMLAARRVHIRFDESQDHVQYSLLFRSLDEHDDMPDRYVSVGLAHDSQPDSWRLLLSVYTCKRSERYSSKRICYKFESVGEELLVAKKEVFLVLGSAALCIAADGEIEQVVTTERKMFEKPLQADDCTSVAEMLRRTVHWAAVTRR